MVELKPWRIDAVLRLLLGLFCCMFIGALLVGWANTSLAEAPESRNLAVFVIGAMSFHGAALLLMRLFLAEHQVGWGEAFGWVRNRTGRAIGIGFATGLAALPLAFIVIRLSQLVMLWFDLVPELQSSVRTLQETHRLSEKILFGVVAVGFAPVVEEVVFRGVLYPAVKALGYPRLALWGTAMLFGASHANLMTFLPLMLFAVALALIYERTGNLLAPIVAHGLFNGANFGFLLLMPEEGEGTEVLNCLAP